MEILHYGSRGQYSGERDPCFRRKREIRVMRVEGDAIREPGSSERAGRFFLIWSRQLGPGG